MSERTRHAAELAARLMDVEHEQWNAGVNETGFAVHNMRPITQIAADVDKLLRLSASLRGIHVRQCNGYEDGLRGQNHEDQDLRRQAKLKKAVTETLAAYGLEWEHNTDPRGSPIGILFPDGAYNTMGGKEAGWRV